MNLSDISEKAKEYKRLALKIEKLHKEKDQLYDTLLTSSETVLREDPKFKPLLKIQTLDTISFPMIQEEWRKATLGMGPMSPKLYSVKDKSDIISISARGIGYRPKHYTVGVYRRMPKDLLVCVVQNYRTFLDSIRKTYKKKYIEMMTELKKIKWSEDNISVPLNLEISRISDKETVKIRWIKRDGLYDASDWLAFAFDDKHDLLDMIFYADEIIDKIEVLIDKIKSDPYLKIYNILHHFASDQRIVENL